MKRLFTTTALGLVLAAAPALAQTNDDSANPSAQPQTEQKAPESGTMNRDSQFQNQPTTSETPDVRPPQDSAERPTADDSTSLAADHGGFRASELIGKSVNNASGETIGEINDIVLGQDGSANAALIGVGGFLGLGEKSVAVDFADLNVQEADGSLKVTVAMSAESLEAMPAYKAEDESQPAEPDTEKKEQERAPGTGSDTSRQ